MSILTFFQDIEKALGIVSGDLTKAGAMVQKSWGVAYGVALEAEGLIGVVNPVIGVELAGFVAIANPIVIAIEGGLATAAQIVTLTDTMMTVLNTYAGSVHVIANPAAAPIASAA